MAALGGVAWELGGKNLLMDLGACRCFGLPCVYPLCRARLPPLPVSRYGVGLLDDVMLARAISTRYPLYLGFFRPWTAIDSKEWFVSRVYRFCS